MGIILPLFVLSLFIHLSLTQEIGVDKEAEQTLLKAYWNEVLKTAPFMHGEPQAFVHVDYESGIHIKAYALYNTKFLKYAPFVGPPMYFPSDLAKLYCLMMLDITAGKDVLQPHTMSPFVLWLHINMRGLDVTSGETVIEYVPPVSMPHMEMHVIIVAVYTQKEYIRWKRKKLKRKCNPWFRAKFNAKKFATEYCMTFDYFNIFRIDFDSGCYEEYKARGHPCDIECDRNYTSDEGTHYGRGDYIYKAIRPLFKRDKSYDISKGLDENFTSYLVTT